MAEVKQRQKGQELYLRAFLIGLILAAAIFIPFQIMDKGYFFFFGDFNVQQIPFYKLANEAIRSGDIGWNWYTDLGANFVSSYSFYLLGSPFFWLTLPFPPAVVPYLMAPLFCLKFAVATLTSYALISRFVKNKYNALIGAVLYAFSGFSIYNIFFNHFHDCIALFPLLLLGLEKYMKDGKRGWFGFAVFVNAMVNYIFFAGEAVFLLIYFIIRISTGDYRLSLRKFLTLAFESVLGFLMASWILFPSILGVLGNTRLSNRLDGWGALTYPNVQRYLQILQSFFFPPELPSRPNFVPDSGAKWSSVAAWLPLVGMSFVIAYLQSTKKNFLRRMMGVLAVFTFIPILNSTFQLLNSAFYVRWFYMLILMMALCTAVSLETADIDYERGFRWNLFISLAFIVGIGFMPTKQENGTYQLGVEAYPDRFWVYSAIVLASMAILYFLIQNGGVRKKSFSNGLLLSSCAIILISSYVFIGYGKSHSYETDFIINSCLDARDHWDLPQSGETENDFYRVDVYKGMDNQPMFWHMPSIQAFQSVVPGSIMEFYPSIGIQRDVASRPEFQYRGLRNLTSVKYLFVNPEGKDDYDFQSMGYRYIGPQNGMIVYENEQFIPLGFTYTEFMTEAQFQMIPSDRRDQALVKAIVLSDEQVKKYGALMTEADAQSLSSTTASQLDNVSYERKESAAYFFKKDKKGFTAKINLPKENLVFFSVPYEEGWSATVDGRPVEVEKVSHGMMAVRAPAGRVEIRFSYKTPGLGLGLIVTGSSVLIYLFYLLLVRKKPQSQKEEADSPISFEEPPLLEGENSIDYFSKMEEEMQRGVTSSPEEVWGKEEVGELGAADTPSFLEMEQETFADPFSPESPAFLGDPHQEGGEISSPILAEQGYGENAVASGAAPLKEFANPTSELAATQMIELPPDHEEAEGGYRRGETMKPNREKENQEKPRGKKKKYGYILDDMQENMEELRQEGEQGKGGE